MEFGFEAVRVQGLQVQLTKVQIMILGAEKWQKMAAAIWVEIGKSVLGAYK